MNGRRPAQPADSDMIYGEGLMDEFDDDLWPDDETDALADDPEEEFLGFLAGGCTAEADLFGLFGF